MSMRLKGGWEIIFGIQEVPFVFDKKIDLADLRHQSQKLTKAIFKIYSLPDVAWRKQLFFVNSDVKFMGVEVKRNFCEF